MYVHVSIHIHVYTYYILHICVVASFARYPLTNLTPSLSLYQNPRKNHTQVHDTSPQVPTEWNRTPTPFPPQCGLPIPYLSDHGQLIVFVHLHSISMPWRRKSLCILPHSPHYPTATSHSNMHHIHKKHPPPWFLPSLQTSRPPTPCALALYLSFSSSCYPRHLATPLECSPRDLKPGPSVVNANPHSETLIPTTIILTSPSP